jgi:hypothetical protein
VTSGVRTEALLGQTEAPAPVPTTPKPAKRVAATPTPEPPPKVELPKIEAIRAAKRTEEVIR